MTTVFPAGIQHYLLGGLLLGVAVSSCAQVLTKVGPVQLLIGGFVAGFGARMSNGCTSGHGICGMGSLQLPSILAVVIFLVTAMISSRLVLVVGGI